MFNKKQFKKRTLTFIITFSVIFFSLFIYDTYAKYTSSLDKTVSAAIARPVIKYEGLNNTKTVSLSLPLDEINPTQNVKEYTFDVANEERNVITDVDIAYMVKVSTTNNLPLDITISCNDSNPKQANISSTMTGSSLFATLNGVFKHSIISYHTYTVTINWQENANDWIYSEQLDELNIEVSWYQQRGEL